MVEEGNYRIETAHGGVGMAALMYSHLRVGWYAECDLGCAYVQSSTRRKEAAETRTEEG